MKKHSFRSMSSAEKKAKLHAVLSSRLRDLLNEEQIDSIMTSVDCSLQYQIDILGDSEEFIKDCMLSDHKETSVVYGAKGTTEIGEVVLGSICFGKSYVRIRHEEEDVSEEMLPSIDISKPCVVTKKIKDWASWDGESYSDIYNKLIIYIPKK